MITFAVYVAPVDSPTDVSVTVIDSLEFSRQGGVLSGEVAVAALGRLADAGRAGRCLHCSFGPDRRAAARTDKLGLALEDSGQPEVRCQRCLGAWWYPLRSMSHLLGRRDAPRSEEMGTSRVKLDDEWDAIRGETGNSVSGC